MTTAHFKQAGLSLTPTHTGQYIVSPLATDIVQGALSQERLPSWTDAPPSSDLCFSAPSRKLRSPRPSFLQELQSRKERESLYVVTEAVETLQDTILQSHDQMRGAGQLSLLQLGHVQVCGMSEWVHGGQ